MDEKDPFIRMRKLLTRRHQKTIREINKLELKVIQFGMAEDKELLLTKRGDKMGTCFALKALDKACQMESII